MNIEHQILIQFMKSDPEIGKLINDKAQELNTIIEEEDCSLFLFEDGNIKYNFEEQEIVITFPFTGINASPDGTYPFVISFEELKSAYYRGRNKDYTLVCFYPSLLYIDKDYGPIDFSLKYIMAKRKDLLPVINNFWGNIEGDYITFVHD